MYLKKYGILKVNVQKTYLNRRTGIEAKTKYVVDNFHDYQIISFLLNGVAQCSIENNNNIKT